jgi:hypothetical protein
VYRGNPARSLFLDFYHGFLNNNPEDTVSLGFLFDEIERTNAMINLKFGCSSPWQEGANTSRKLKFGGAPYCDRPKGLLVLDPAKRGDFDSVYIEYSLLDRSTSEVSDRLHFVFEGRRQ